MPFLGWMTIPWLASGKCNHAMLGIAKGFTIAKRKTFSKLWHCYNEYNTSNKTQECNLNKVFANHSEEEKIFPLTTQEIAEAQKANDKLKHYFNRNAVLDKGLEVSLVDNTHVVCKDSIGSAKQDDIYGASNIILPCPGS
jgi:hypothetical protein